MALVFGEPVDGRFFTKNVLVLFRPVSGAEMLLLSGESVGELWRCGTDRSGLGLELVLVRVVPRGAASGLVVLDAAVTSPPPTLD
jgi:hypothetical protein